MSRYVHLLQTSTTDQAAPDQLTIPVNKLPWQQHITKPGGTVLCIQILQKIEKRMESLLPDVLCINLATVT